ncbi:FAD binding domain-containing protein [Crepidotus variabilis]|uniref:FAD binding domain-containing protein n=1 Tax=Crepidotus variabilis TaxID=179855 RepID=A0A9P6EAN4_9AGAR|nr:FAD binding domain-containing protein [Crepidotus variabilis]
MSSPNIKQSPKVLIVGAGPTGLTHALALLHHGIPVRIIDKNPAPIHGQRGSGLHPRTFEILESLGVLDEVWKLSHSIGKVKIYKMPGGTEIEKEIINPVPNPTPDVPFPSARLHGQNHLERILTEAISTYGYSVERGIELKTFEQQENSDVVHVTLCHLSSGETVEGSYAYLIGADGGKSVVRKQLGLPFVGETREERLILGDFVMEGMNEQCVHVWGEMSDLSLMARPTETQGLFTLHLGGANLNNYVKTESDIEKSFETLLKPATGGREDIKIKEKIWVGQYRFNIRMAPEFSKGRVFLAGDAGHVHSPTGGQGLNTGVHDSYNLAWKLALVLKNQAPPSLLSTYNIERVPIVSEMLNITTELMLKTFARNANQDSSTFDRGGKLNLLGVNYRFSPIVIDGGEKQAAVSPYGGAPGDHVRAGDRAPDAPGLLPLDKPGDVGITDEPHVTRLFKILDLRWHIVLIFEDNIPGGLKLDSTTAMYSPELVRFVVVRQSGQASHTGTVNSTAGLKIFEDTQGHAYKAYKSNDDVSNVFVIRPDGYVGARLKDIKDVRTYFQGVFGDE